MPYTSLSQETPHVLLHNNHKQTYFAINRNIKAFNLGINFLIKPLTLVSSTSAFTSYCGAHNTHNLALVGLWAIGMKENQEEGQYSQHLHGYLFNHFVLCHVLMHYVQFTDEHTNSFIHHWNTFNTRDYRQVRESSSPDMHVLDCRWKPVHIGGTYKLSFDGLEQITFMFSDSTAYNWANEESEKNIYSSENLILFAQCNTNNK